MGKTNSKSPQYRRSDDIHLLPPASTCEFHRSQPQRNHRANRLCRRLPLHLRHDPLHRRASLGRISIQVVFCAHACPSSPWSCSPRRLLLLGNLRSQVPYVPFSSEKGTSCPGTDSRHHVHLWSELLLRDSILANASFQCLRT